MDAQKDHDEGKELSAEHAEFQSQASAPFQIPKVTWWKHPGLRRLYVMMPILFLASTINGYDGSLLNGLQTMAPWRNYKNFDNPTGSDLGLLTAIQTLEASVPSSYIADLLGRRIGVALGIIVIFVGTIVQVVPSVGRGMFIAGRFLVGFGSSISQGSAPLLIIELAHPQHRGTLTTMYNMLWYGGSIIAAWTVLGTVRYTSNASWRIPVGMQAAMPLIHPRWLCAKGRDEEAFKVLVKYHGNGDHNDPFCEWQFHEIQNTISLEKENSGNSWALLVKAPRNRKRLLLIALVSFFSQCSGNGLVSYYIHSILTSVGIESSSEQAIINGGLQIWSFLVAIGFSAFLVDVLGRRKLFLIAAVGMSITFSVWTGTEDSRAGSAVIAMIFLFYGVAGFAWPGLTIAYCAEILPFNIRAKEIALNLAMTALASFFNQLAVAILLWVYRNPGPILEEIALLFDGEKANIPNPEELGMEKNKTNHSGLNS
ncbi:general substrate transporter [Aspergillus californicus]